MGDITRRQSFARSSRTPLLAILLVVVLALSLGAVAAAIATNSLPEVRPTATGAPPTVAVAIPAVPPTASDPAVAAALATATPAALTVGTPTPTPTSDGRFAILLLGYGGGGHDGSLLTDAMMVVVGDTERKTISLLSLPRDIWAPLPFDDSPIYAKLNTAYAQATIYRPTPSPRGAFGVGDDHYPGRFTRETVESILGIELDYYVALDFEAFREAVDAIGGLEVVVPNGFTAQYPRNDDPSIDSGWKIVSFAAGPERMDGDRALVYTRARLTLDNSGEGSDFARAVRQRIVLNAFRERLLTATGLTRLPALLTIANQRTQTDYPIPAAADLAKLLVSAREVGIYQATLGLDNYLVEGTGPQGAYILIPRADGASWSQIQAFTQRLLSEPAAAEAIAGHRLTVIDQSGRSGFGERVVDRLAALGYPVGDAIVRTKTSATRLVVRGGDDRMAALLAETLANDLGLSSIPLEVESAQGHAPRTATLELGSDATDATTSRPPANLSAPRSSYGVLHSGYWLPPTATPDLTPTDSGTLTPPVAGDGTVVPDATPDGTPPASQPATTAPATSPQQPPTATKPPAAPAAPVLPSPPTATPAPPPAATSAPPPPAATAAPPPAATSILTRLTPRPAPTIRLPAP